MATRKKTVLIVDDESPQRAWMRGILKRQGYAVLEAADYTEALARTRDTEIIDLFLIDLRLPGGSGYDLSEEVRLAHPYSKILFVSGTAGAELCKYFARPLTEVQFLHKPFEASQLAERVREIFGSSETRVANACGDESLHHEAPAFAPAVSASKRQRKC